MRLKNNAVNSVPAIQLHTTEFRIILLKIVPLRNRTLPKHRRRCCIYSWETAQKIFNRNCFQLLCHNPLDIIHGSKMTTPRMNFSFWRQNGPTQTRIEEIKKLYYHENNFIGVIQSWRLSRDEKVVSNPWFKVIQSFQISS